MPTRRTHARPERRSRRALWVSVSLLLALVLVAVGGVWGLQQWLAGRVEQFGDPFAALADRPDPGPAASSADDGPAPLTLLVLGTDSRISAGDPSLWQAGAQRTDTMMLVHLPADGGAAYVMSVPRDSWVDVPGYGEAKINAAFAYGGPSLTVATVEQLTGVRVDHVVVADFEAFATITDTLGGVRITLDSDLDAGGTVVPAGQHQLLTGEQALAWVRERKSLPRGDFDRMHRQQAWVRAVVARVRNERTLANPLTAVPFLRDLGDAVATDDGLDAAAMEDLRGRVEGLASTDIVFFTVPTQGTGRSPDGAQSIVVLDRPALDELMAAVRADDVAGYLAERADDVDLLPPVVG